MMNSSSNVIKREAKGECFLNFLLKDIFAILIKLLSAPVILLGAQRKTLASWVCL